MTEKIQSGDVAQPVELSEAMLEAGAQALANDVWHPSQPLASMAKSEANKFRRQALIALKAALAAQPPAAPVETDADLPTHEDVRGILPRSSAGTGDDEAAKLINQYLGVSGIDAEDVNYFRAVLRDTQRSAGSDDANEIVYSLRKLYATHPICQQAADEIVVLKAARDLAIQNRNHWQAEAERLRGEPQEAPEQRNAEAIAALNDFKRHCRTDISRASFDALKRLEVALGASK